MRALNVLLMIVFSVAFSREALAKDWASAAQACAPDPDSVSDGIHDFGSGNVTFKTNVTGTFNLVCAVTDNEVNDPNNLYATYQDSSGTTTSSDVRAILKRASKSTGSVSVIATFDSDNESDDTVHESDAVSFSHTYNYDTHFYYIELDVTRGSTSHTVKIHGVSLRFIVP